MVLPDSSKEQRAIALARAHAVRRTRASVKGRLKRREISIVELLEQAVTDDAIGKMRVSEVLEALPGVGRTKAGRLMTEFQIAPTRRLRGLGERQRLVLLARFGSHDPPGEATP